LKWQSNILQIANRVYFIESHLRILYPKNGFKLFQCAVKFIQQQTTSSATIKDEIAFFFSRTATELYDTEDFNKYWTPLGIKLRKLSK
jgi:hypothetical protein